MSITTERLILRPWQDSDLEAFAALNSCDFVTEFLPKKLSREESDALAAHIQAHITEHGWGFWAVELRATGDFIGFVGIAHYRGETAFAPAVEIGWRLQHSAWGNGYATEAAKAALEFAFTQLELDEVVSFTTLANKPSQRVMQKIGMQHDSRGDFMHPALALDSPLAPHCLYRLRRVDWLALTQQ